MKARREDYGKSLVDARSDYRQAGKTIETVRSLKLGRDILDLAYEAKWEALERMMLALKQFDRVQAERHNRPIRFDRVWTGPGRIARKIADFV